MSLNRRDFVKSLGVAVTAFASYREKPIAAKALEGEARCLQPPLLRTEDFWTLTGEEYTHDLLDEHGVPIAVVSYGWKVTLTQTTRSQPHFPELAPMDLKALRYAGLPGKLAVHLQNAGFEKFLTHQRRCRGDERGVIFEQEWIAWQNPEINETLWLTSISPRNFSADVETGEEDD